MKRIGPSVTVALGYLLIAGASVWAVVREGALKGMSRWIFLEIDLPSIIFLCLIIAILTVAVLLCSEKTAQRIAAFPFRRIPPAAISAAALLAAAVGVHLVHHDYAFSMDEWMTKLQGALFLSGQLAGETPEALQPYVRSFLHIFASYDQVSGAFASDYRPGMAALYALFEVFGAGSYTSAILNAAAVVFTSLAARRIWPDRRDAQIIAALIVAVSPQALAAATTTYAMSAHLCLATLWLWLFLRDTFRSHVCAAIVGVCAASLHQIHVHAFFAAPFLLTLLSPLRIRLIALYGVIYLAGHGLVYAWDIISMGGAVETGGPVRSLSERFLRLFALPDFWNAATSGVNLSRLLIWQNAALAPLLFAVVLRRFWTGWTPVIAASVLVSFAPYPFLMPDQGHGWGYRYLHVVIGNLALLGAAGWVALSGAEYVRLRALAVLLLFTTAIAAPLDRAVRIEAFVKPYAQATERVMAAQADIVIIEDETLSYGGDIARFDPVHFSRPTAMRHSRLSDGAVKEICERYDVIWFDRSALLDPRAKPIIGCKQTDLR